MKKLTLFDYLNQIYYKSSNLEYDKKIANPYMLTMWLSHDKILLPIVDKMNKLQWYMKPEHIYKYYWYKVPKGKRYIPWIKKDPVNKKTEKQVEEIKGTKGLSSREAKMLVKHLTRCEK